MIAPSPEPWRLFSDAIRIGFAVFGILLVGAVGCAVTGIGSVIILELLSVVLGPAVTVDALNRAYASTPWGAAAYLMSGLLCAGTLTGAWFGWRASVQLFSLLPPESLAVAPAACVGSLFLLFFLSLFYLPVPLRLAVSHAITTGHLRQLYPQDHATAAYTYTVNGKNFQCIGNPVNFDKAAAGDAVTVYYSPNDPALSILWKPDGLLLNNFLNVLAVSALFGLAPFTLTAARNWMASLPKGRRG